MNNILIGAVLCIIILIVTALGVVIIGDKSPIFPYDGDKDSDPDSGDGQDPNQVSVAVKIIAPATTPYHIPETGMEHGKYWSISIKGYVYGLNISKVQKVTCEWVGTDWEKQTLYRGHDGDLL